MMDYAEKMQRCHEYVEGLEEERRKIQVFKRDLPLCLELVTQTIEVYMRELSGTTTEYNKPSQSESSEQTSSDHGPVLEEFIPIKPTTTYQREHNDNGGEEESLSSKLGINGGISSSSSSGKEKDKKKSDWLRSVQLWNQSSPDPFPPTLTKQEVPRKVVVTEVKRNGTGGAFQPFQREKSKSTVAANTGNNNNNNNSDRSFVATKAVPSAKMVGSGGGGGGECKEEGKDACKRKQRRRWSPELHRRFLHALQQLGGSDVATPKHIRELMKADGLTNDEIKSHLQKYRLHARRPSPTIHNNSNPQTPQFVAVGGIWVSPPGYASVAATAVSQEPATLAATKAIHAPVATITAVPSATPQAPVAQNPDQKQHLQVSEGRGSHSDGDQVHSNSPATSSSIHTTTTSPIY